MKPTYSRTWPSQPPVRKFGTAPGIITDTKGTFFDGNSLDSKQLNTAPMKARYATMKKHGKEAFRRTLK